MPYRNNILAGTALVRDAINSPNYRPGEEGWSINKDGSAEFNDILIRGGLVVTLNANSANYVPATTGWILRSDGTAEFNSDVVINNGKITTGMAPNARVSMEVYTDISGLFTPIPALLLYDGVNADPAFFFAEEDGTQTGWALATGSYVGPGEIGRVLRLDTLMLELTNEAGSMGFRMGMDTAYKSYPNADPIFANALQLTNAPGGIFNDTFETTYPYLTDGKVFTGTVSAVTSTSTTPVAVPNANAVNAVLTVDQVYRASGMVSVSSSVAGDRATIGLYNGTVGGANKLGGDVNIRLPTASGFQSFPFSFVWRQNVSTTAANINLSILRLSGSGTITAQADGNYFMLIEDMGTYNKVGGL